MSSDEDLQGFAFGGEEDDFEEEFEDGEDDQDDDNVQYEDEFSGSENDSAEHINSNKKSPKPVENTESLSEEDQDNDEREIKEQKILDELKKARFSASSFFDFSNENEVYLAQKEEANQDEIEEENLKSYIVKRSNNSQADPLDDEKIKSILKQAPEFTSFVKEFKQKINEVKQKFLAVAQTVQSRDSDIKSGMSYIDVKFNLISFYCQFLSFYVLLKIQGKSVKDHPVIRRLIYIKTLLSKLKPVDKKLEYQLSKLLRLANQENLVGHNYKDKIVEEDPLLLKPNPEALSNKLTTEDIDVDDGGNVIDSSSKSKNIYKAPKLSGVLMGDDVKQRREERENLRARRKFIKSQFLKDLQEEYDDDPIEIKQNEGFINEEDDEDKRRRRYEEENFTRLPETKEFRRKQKEKKRKLEQKQRVDDFSEFEQVRAAFKLDQSQRKKQEMENEEKLKKTLGDYVVTKRKRNTNAGKPHGESDEDFTSKKKVVSDWRTEKRATAVKSEKKDKKDDLSNFFVEEGDHDDVIVDKSENFSRSDKRGGDRGFSRGRGRGSFSRGRGNSSSRGRDRSSFSRDNEGSFGGNKRGSGGNRGRGGFAGRGRGGFRGQRGNNRRGNRF